MDKPEIQVVLFDAGNTLLVPSQPVGDIYAESASRYGVHADGSVLQQAFHQAWKEFRSSGSSQKVGVLGEKQWWLYMVRRTWEIAGIPVFSEFEAYFEELYALFSDPSVWKLFPDVRETLSLLRQKQIRCGILSNWDPRLRILLDKMDLNSFFEHMIISSEVGVEKPDPEIFRYALRCFQVDPSHVLMIGDHTDLDITPARQLGMHAVRIDRMRQTLPEILSPYHLL